MWSNQTYLRCIIYVFVVLIPCGAIAEPVAKIYWAERDIGLIKMANIDGTNVEVLLDGISRPAWIAATPYEGKLYWTTNHNDGASNDAIQCADLDGSNLETLVTGLNDARGIALDIVAGKMYWQESGSRALRRSNTDGTDIEDVIIFSHCEGRAIAILSQEDKMYFTRPVARADLDGSNIEILVTETSREEGICIYEAGNAIYWTSCTLGNIFRANLDGTNFETLVYETGCTVGVAVDAASGKLFWTNMGPGSPPDAGKIQCSDMDGANVQDIVTGLTTPMSLAIVEIEPINTSRKKWGDLKARYEGN